MRIDYIDDTIIIYMDYKEYDIENICYETIKKIKDYFNIELKGFYKVNVYIDKNNGIVLEYSLEDKNLYINYNKVDLNIQIYNTIFLYEIEDILDIEKIEFIIYKNKYYIKKINCDLKIIDFCSLVYKNTDEIINNGIIMCKYYNKVVEKK